MSEETQLYKMNVRSPFFVVANSEGKPESITEEDPQDQTEEDQPDTPDEYIEPTDQTEIVTCGKIIKVGTDVGTRFFKLDTEGNTGDFSITWTVNRPIRITASYNTSTGSYHTFFNGNLFIGNSQYEQELVDAGVQTYHHALGSGVQTGTFTVPKSDTTDRYIKYKVEAPLETDDYAITFSCPVVSINTTLTPVGDPSIIQNVAGFMIDQYSRGPYPRLMINGSVAVDGMIPSQMYILDDNDLGNTDYPYEATAVSEFYGPKYEKTTNYISRSTYMKKGINEIVIRYSGSFHAAAIHARYGIFHDGTSFRHTFANSGRKYTQHGVHPINLGTGMLFGGVWMGSYVSDPTVEYYENKYYWYEGDNGLGHFTLRGQPVNPSGVARYANQDYEIAQCYELYTKKIGQDIQLTTTQLLPHYGNRQFSGYGLDTMWSNSD